MSLHDIAKQVQSKGRDEDTVLIHMTPGEVNGLQQLAMAHGGSLTINPETGLPEAGFLKKLLPMIAGAALAATGIGAPMAALLVAGGSTGLGLSKGKGLGGSLKQGLMAGLGAYGGASMAAGFGVGTAGTAATKAVGEKAVTEAAKTAATEAAKTGVTAAVPGVVTPTAETIGRSLVPSISVPYSATAAATNAAAPFAVTPSFNVATSGVGNAVKYGAEKGIADAANAGLSGFGARFGEAAKAPLFEGGKNYLGSYAPQVAAMGALHGISKAATPSAPKFNTEEEKSNYAGPYEPTPRVAQFPGVGEVAARDPNDSSEFQYFDRVNPTPSYMPSSRLLDQRGVRDLYPTAAAGGEMNMKDGAFVLDARTVSELGNGSSNAGKEVLSRIGGVPINGPGDGVSDSIHARIGGTQEARVARDEVMVPPEAVKQMGGAGKLYALMDKAHKARKTADRGEDTGLSRGLMA
ncbi:hypothetical protein UFOVP1295_11 [uncultured Caudovirales phage]|uniref:Uncharacterized protein n=1 Tax=uncultured Caudovirales phage TaxID=2100421 RepID=A0A6J5RPA6_9CAUD|nr:hypothetical protein UFOVP1295_11 [uncultured Caudovirales phage]